MGKIGKGTPLPLLAIYSLIFLSNGTMLISPAIDALVNAFPGEAYSKVLFVYTLPSLVALPFTLLSGIVVGRKVRLRTVLLIAIPVYLLSGIAPFFLRSLNGLLFCRAIFGVCLGFIAPQGNALILQLFSREARYRFLGYGNVVVGIAGMVFQFLGGYLCVLGWNHVFLGYLVASIPLVLIAVWLPEPAHTEPQQRTASAPASAAPVLKPRQLHREMIRLFFLICIVYTCSQAKMLTVSSIVASEGLGDSKTSAGILSVSTIGAMLGGILFPLFCRTVRRYRIPVLLLILGLTTSLNLANSPMLIALGFGIGTTAFMMNLDLMMLRASSLFGEDGSSRAMSLVQFAEKCGVFISTFFTSFMVYLSQSLPFDLSMYKAPVVASMTIYLILAAVDFKLSGPEAA